MTALVAGDVSYSIIKKSNEFDGIRTVIARLTFGNASLTLPAGGLPLAIANLGFANAMYGFAIVGSSFVGKSLIPDSVNAKLKVYKDAGSAGDMAEDTSAPASTTVDVLAFGY